MEKIKDNKVLSQPQCQYFVVRKKRLCRMTVRPGRDYCGEHEPQPRTEKGKDDTRIPCPYDPKHTCYASKLLKHLAICNARQGEAPAYIVRDVNAPSTPTSPRLPLSQIPRHKILALIDKVNILYDKYVKGTITNVEEQPIHSAVAPDFLAAGRAESSLRHLRQASSLLHLMEAEGLVQNGTCYVELGAGKGHLSYYAYRAWCGDSASRVLLVDRASLRHKRDNKLRPPRAASDCATSATAPEGASNSTSLRNAAAGCSRIRADLAHLALEKVPEVAQCNAVVGFAKHLCGVATDYALRCAARARGLALAPCCHHRCEPAGYVATRHLQEMGITAEDFNIMLGIVSWATCGDGRSRERRLADYGEHDEDSARTRVKRARWGEDDRAEEAGKAGLLEQHEVDGANEATAEREGGDTHRRSGASTGSERETKDTSSGLALDRADTTQTRAKRKKDDREGDADMTGFTEEHEGELECANEADGEDETGVGAGETRTSGAMAAHGGGAAGGESGVRSDGKMEEIGTSGLILGREARARAGRRAKALLDHGRVRWLRERGLRARLVRYVPRAVTPEDVCIVARAD